MPAEVFRSDCMHASKWHCHAGSKVSFPHGLRGSYSPAVDEDELSEGRQLGQRQPAVWTLVIVPHPPPPQRLQRRHLLGGNKPKGRGFAG